MRGFGIFDNSTSKRILNKLDTVYMRLKKIEVNGVAVIKFRVITDQWRDECVGADECENNNIWAM